MKFCKNEQSGCTPDCSFCLLGHFPNPLGTLDFSNGCAFLRNAFCSRTSRSRFIFFNFGVLFYTEDAINIRLYDQQFFHLISGLAVLRVGSFFLGDQLGVLGIDLFYSGQLFQPGIIKVFLCGLVEQNIAFMLS